MVPPEVEIIAPPVESTLDPAFNTIDDPVKVSLAPVLIVRSPEASLLSPVEIPNLPDPPAVESPLEILTSPLVNDDAADTMSTCPLVVADDAPEDNRMLPPVLAVDFPAATVMLPPMPDELSPTERDTDPAEVAASPEFNVNVPETVPVPDCKVTEPDSAPLFDDAIDTDPPEPPALAALFKTILPPVCCELSPAVNKISPPEVPTPAFMSTLPPRALFESPACTEKVPPAPVSATPIVTLTAPDAPAVAAPVAIVMLPDAPALDVPVCITMTPLTPEVPALEVITLTLPLDVLLPAPLEICTFPPVSDKLLPPIIFISGPVPRFESPAESSIDPALLFALAPVRNRIDPLAPDEAVPVCT